MTLDGLLDPDEDTGDLLRFVVGGVYLMSICCLVVSVEARGEYGCAGILISKMEIKSPVTLGV